jgi:hypothetical protein
MFNGPASVSLAAAASGSSSESCRPRAANPMDAIMSRVSFSDERPAQTTSAPALARLSAIA